MLYDTDDQCDSRDGTGRRPTKHSADAFERHASLFPDARVIQMALRTRHGQLPSGPWCCPAHDQSIKNIFERTVSRAEGSA